MEAKELRIGNLVNCNGVLSSVLTLDEEGGLFTTIGKNEPDFESPQISPIPLTEEWLLKFGFDKYMTEIIKGTFKLEWDKNGRFYFTWYDIVWLDNVHTLQNLYFCLTGEELEWKG